MTYVATETAPPLYSSTGSLHGDLANLRQRRGNENDPPAATSLEIRRNELPDYTTAPDAHREQTLAISDFIVDDDLDNEEVRAQIEAEVVAGLYRAIENGQDEIINAFISSGFATVGTKDRVGRTPLGAACDAGHIRIVQQLVDFGADVNEFSTYISPIHCASDRMQRTPLMIAAHKGNLPLVKLLVDVYHCDDSLVAPDGMLALRIAAVYKRKEIVDYLPTRRGGGMKRWKYKNKKALLRIRSAGYKIYRVGKFFIWDVPKFLLYQVPKHAVILPLWQGLKFLHMNRDKLAGWIWSFLVNTSKAIVEFSKKLPERAWRFAKAFSRFMVRAVKEVARGLKEFSVYIYKVTVHFFRHSLPRVTAQVCRFIKSAVVTTVKLIGDFVGKVASAIHTLVVVILRFIKSLTWRDVMNGFIEVFKWIFITLPKSVWAGGKATLKFLEWGVSVLFGWLGDCVIIILRVLKEMIIYIPRLLWQILSAIGDIFKRGTDEIRVWINPKTAV